MATTTPEAAVAVSSLMTEALAVAEGKETEQNVHVNEECQVGLGESPLGERLKPVLEKLRYMRALACRVLDLETALLWEAAATQTDPYTATTASTASAASASAACGDCPSATSPGAGSQVNKATQTSPTERDRLHDVIEAERLVQVYERCRRVMVEESRRTCAACRESAGDGLGGADGDAAEGEGVRAGAGPSDAAAPAHTATGAPQRRNWRRLLWGIFTRCP